METKQSVEFERVAVRHLRKGDTLGDGTVIGYAVRLSNTPKGKLSVHNTKNGRVRESYWNPSTMVYRVVR